MERMWRPDFPDSRCQRSHRETSWSAARRCAPTVATGIASWARLRAPLSALERSHVHDARDHRPADGSGDPAETVVGCELAGVVRRGDGRRAANAEILPEPNQPSRLAFRTHVSWDGNGEGSPRAAMPAIDRRSRAPDMRLTVAVAVAGGGQVVAACTVRDLPITNPVVVVFVPE